MPLRLEIEQQRPFSSLEEEALLNLLRTADCLQRSLEQTARRWSVTSTQYNVLRILRGAGAQGLTCSGIGRRMIAAEPDMTRLLGRLKARKLIRQQRDRGDRRVVWTQIAPAGLELLSQMDSEVGELPARLLGHLERADLGELIRMLESIRAQTSLAPVEQAETGA